MKNRVGEKNINCIGEVVEIIRYDNWNNVKVRFEDGSVKNTRYEFFKNGKIKSKNGSRLSRINNRVGERRMSNLSGMMEIIQYNSCRDIVVKFDDGSVKRANYDRFKRGTIKSDYLLGESLGGLKMEVERLRREVKDLRRKLEG